MWQQKKSIQLRQKKEGIRFGADNIQRKNLKEQFVSCFDDCGFNGYSFYVLFLQSVQCGILPQGSTFLLFFSVTSVRIYMLIVWDCTRGTPGFTSKRKKNLCRVILLTDLMTLVLSVLRMIWPHPSAYCVKSLQNLTVLLSATVVLACELILLANHCPANCKMSIKEKSHVNFNN